MITSVEGKFEATKDRVASEMRRLNSPASPTNRIVRNGVQVMPKEFIEDPQGSAERLEKPENIDKILPHNVIHEYYAPTTRVIFVIGKFKFAKDLIIESTLTVICSIVKVYKEHFVKN